MQDEWCGTANDVRAELKAYLEDRIKATGATDCDLFPWACKITELRRIGRLLLDN